MTNYSKTWDTDSPSYNALTERSFGQIEDNLALMWQAKDTRRLLDSSSNGHHLDVRADVSPAASDFAGFNGKMVFGRGGGGQPADSTAFDLNNFSVWTIEGKSGDLSGQTDHEVFISLYDGSNANKQFRLMHSDGGNNLQFTWFDSGGTSRTLNGTTGALSDGNPHDWAIEYDGTTLRMYVDGNVDASTTSDLTWQSISVTDTLLRVGSANDGLTVLRPATSGVDELRFSDTARYAGAYTPATVPFTDDANTVALWHLDEMVGQNETNNSWSEESASRAFGTTYTNNTGRPMYVLVSVNLVSTAGALNPGDPASATLQVQDPTDGAFVTIGAHAIPATPALGGSRNRTACLMTIVNDGGDYRVNVVTGADSGAAIVNWTEWVFDATYVPQNLTHGHVVDDLTEINKYANGVNAVMDPDGNVTEVSSSPPTNTEAFPTEGFTTFISWNFSLNNEAVEVDLADAGGALTRIARVYNSVSAGNQMTVPLFVNAGGSVRHRGGPVPTVESALARLPVHASIVFDSGEKGKFHPDAVVDDDAGAKMRSLDTNASLGTNVTKPWPRIDDGSGSGLQANGSRVAIVVVAGTMNPTAFSSAGFHVQGNADRGQVSINAGQGSGHQRMAANIVNPNVDYSSAINNATVDQKWRWMVAV